MKRKHYYDYIATNPEGESWFNTFDDKEIAKVTRDALIRVGWTCGIIHHHCYGDSEKIEIMESRCDETAIRVFNYY